LFILILKRDTLKCKNDPSLYTPIIVNLLYKDSLNNVFLRLASDKKYLLSFKNTLNKCQKIPYHYLESIVTLDDSLTTLKNIVDHKSFAKHKNTNIFYYDKKRTYAFQDSPATYPQFSEIDIQQGIPIDSLYIKDKKNVYWKGIKIKGANPLYFKASKITSKNGQKINLIHDNKTIYFLSRKMSIERLKNLPLTSKKIDSLISIYF